MNETSLGFIDSLYLRFLGVPATEEQRLSLGFIMESEGLSVRETTIRFIEDNLKNSLFHEYYIQFPESSPSVDELIAWAESQGKNDAETSELVSLIAFDLFAINVNKTQGGVEFLSQPTIETVENQVDTGLQVGVDNNENITYSLVDTSFGVDRNLFNIDSDTGITSFKEAKNFESPEDSNKDNVYQITVAASNSLTKVDVFQNISITVSDDNDAPEIESGQSMENLENRTPSDTLITVAAIDKDKDSSIENFSIVSGNNQDFFEIDNQGNISLTSKGADSQANDFEVVENEYILAVVATDNKGLQSEPEEVSLFIADIEEREFSLTGIEEVIEGETAKYDIIMTGGDVSEDSIIELSLLVSSGSALENVDFNNDPNNNNLTISGPFSDGDVVASINVVTENDTLLESGEDFSVTLSAAMIDGNNVPVTTPESVSTTIVDNEAIEFTLTGDTAAIEGGIANYQITITGGDVSEDSIIVLSLSAIAGTALTPADFGLIDFGDSVEFDPTSNTLTLSGPFNDGDIITNISVGAVDDNLVESNENFAVTLNSATIDDNSATATGTVQTTIVDNEDIVFTLTGDSSAIEGSTANYQITMTGGDVSASSTTVLSLSVLAGTALTPADFGQIDIVGNSVQFDPNNNTLTIIGPITDGDLVANINVATVDDKLAEGDEDFTLALSSATIDGNSASTTGTVKTTIVDNDAYSFNLTGDISVSEGGTASYSIVLTGADIQTGSTVELNLNTSNGAALLFSDFNDLNNANYNAATNTLSLTGPFSVGDTVASMTVDTIDDSLYEADEDFQLILSSGTVDGTTVDASDSISTTILDNETLAFTLSGTDGVSEGETASYAVVMTGGDLLSGDIVTLDLDALSGTAVSPADFSDLSGSGYDSLTNQLTINGNFISGDTVATLSIPTAFDVDVELEERFSVSLSGGTGVHGDISANNTVTTDISDVPVNIINVTGFSGTSFITGSFTPGIDKVVVDYGDARYFNAGNFDLSGFSDIDILSFNTLDGAVILSHKTHSFTSNLGRNFISSGNRLTTFTTTISSSHTFTFTSGLTSSQDKILYSGSSVKLSSSLAFSVGRSVNSIQISGLPDNLTAGNFEFI
ncbi:MAG: Calx-beta domain-containing protein [Methylococcaceae bacterium]